MQQRCRPSTTMESKQIRIEWLSNRRFWKTKVNLIMKKANRKWIRNIRIPWKWPILEPKWGARHQAVSIRWTNSRRRFIISRKGDLSKEQQQSLLAVEPKIARNEGNVWVAAAIIIRDLMWWWIIVSITSCTRSLKKRRYSRNSLSSNWNCRSKMLRCRGRRMRARLEASCQCFQATTSKTSQSTPNQASTSASLHK